MSTLKGVFPNPKPIKQKNFIQENVKNLRRMEQFCHMNKGIDEAKKVQHLQNKTDNKYENVQPKLYPSLNVRKHESNDRKLIINNKIEQQQEFCTKSSTQILTKSNTCKKKMIHSTTHDNAVIMQKRKDNNNSQKFTVNVHRKVLSDSNFSYKSCKDNKNKSKMQIKLRNQGIQTLDEDQIDKLYSEGIIRYPSKKCLNYDNPIKKNEINQQTDKALKNVKNLSSNEGNVQFLGKDVQNTTDIQNAELFSPKVEADTKLNKESISVSSKAAVRIQNNNCNNNNNPPANYRKGVVPKYIKDRKEAQEKEQKAKAELLDPNCPNGHVPLPDHERTETLRILKKSYQDYVNELNMMPIKTDTLKARRRKAEIEKQLNKLEEGIKVFSKPKVYVKMNA